MKQNVIQFQYGDSPVVKVGHKDIWVLVKTDSELESQCEKLTEKKMDSSPGQSGCLQWQKVISTDVRVVYTEVCSVNRTLCTFCPFSQVQIVSSLLNLFWKKADKTIN